MTYPIETLKYALRFSLAQWKMYSDTRSGRADDLDTADTPEGKAYRLCKAALGMSIKPGDVNYVDKGFLVTSSMAYLATCKQSLHLDPDMPAEELRFIEHHGNIRQRGSNFITENEHWIVNGKRFDHEPTDAEVLDVQPKCPRRPPHFEQFEECDNCPDCDCGTLIDVSFTPYVVACDNCGRLFRKKQNVTSIERSLK